jgi:hypothetical protein
MDPDARHPLYTTGAHVITLRVETAGGSMWMLPWHHFVFGQHQDEGDRERLVLTFVAHEVVMRGSNLGVLMTEIVNQRLELVRAGPGRYIQSLDDKPFVDDIHVRPLAEPTVAR